MKTRHLRMVLSATLGAVLGTTSLCASSIHDLLPLQKGYVVSTCFSNSDPLGFNQDPDGPVVLIFDATPNELANAGTGSSGGSYDWRRFHNEVSVQNPNLPDAAQEWKAANLGEVFGLTLDDAENPNIYLSATTVFGAQPTPVGNHHGTVYRLDGTTGEITPFNCIKADVASLGNISFARSTDGAGSLYVSNLDDGLIYHLDVSGKCLGTYDHGVDGRPAAGLLPFPDVPIQSYTPTGRRVWGLEVHNGRLFYGVWNTLAPEVWSVSLDPSGVPLPATAQVEIPASSFLENYPISDLAFSNNGELYTAHRHHQGAAFGSLHQSSVLEFSYSGGSWDNPSPANTIRVGNYGDHQNSAGGVGVDCSGAVWVTGDGINFEAGNYIYGAQRIPAGGNAADVPAIANSHVIDFDCDLQQTGKDNMGDIHPYDPCDNCFDVFDIRIECPLKDGEPYTVSFKLTNRSDQIVHYLWHTPCPDPELPDGVLTGQPTPTLPPITGPIELSEPLAPGDCTLVKLYLPAPLTGGTFCWNITLLDESGAECCTDKLCLDLPDCSCFVVIDKSLECVIDDDGNFKYTLDIKIANTSDFAWHHVNLLPPSLFTPSNFSLDPPVNSGDTYLISTCLEGLPGDKVAFNIAVHSENIDLCCSKECCIILPECDGAHPDRCKVTQVVPCCPNVGDLPAVGTGLVSICNNSPVERTYNWSLTVLPPSGDCTGVLSQGDAAFAPAPGSITLAPNTCQIFPFVVNCDGLNPGESACYQLCVQQVGNPGNTFCCGGMIVGLDGSGPILKDDPNNLSAVTVLHPNRPVRRNIEVINPTASRVDYSFEARSPGGAVLLASPDAVSPGANTTKRFRVRLEPFSTKIVSILIEPSKHLAFDNTVIPVLLYPLDELGLVQPTSASFFVMVPTPREGAPVLKAIAQHEDGSFSMTLETTPGVTYRIESSQSLGSDANWGPVTCSSLNQQEMTSEFIANSNVLILRITPDPDCPTNFFRALQVP